MATGFNKVPINSCGFEQLLTLPGVGPKIANGIMDLRDKGLYIDLETLCLLPYLRVTKELLDLVDFGPKGPPTPKEIKMAQSIMELQSYNTGPTLPELMKDYNPESEPYSEWEYKFAEMFETPATSAGANQKDDLNDTRGSEMWWDREDMGKTEQTNPTKMEQVPAHLEPIKPKGTSDWSFPVKGTSTPAEKLVSSPEQVYDKPQTDYYESKSKIMPPLSYSQQLSMNAEVERLRQQILQLESRVNTQTPAPNRAFMGKTDQTRQQPTDELNQHTNQQVQQGRQLFKTPQQGTRGGPPSHIKSEPDYPQHNSVVDHRQHGTQQVQPEPYTNTNQQPGDYHPKVSTPYTTTCHDHDNTRQQGINKEGYTNNNPKQQLGNPPFTQQRHQQVQFSPIYPQQGYQQDQQGVNSVGYTFNNPQQQSYQPPIMTKHRQHINQGPTNLQQGQQVDNNHQQQQFKTQAPIYIPPPLRQREAPQFDINIRQQHQPTYSGDPTYLTRGNQSVYYNPDDHTDESSYESDTSTDYHPFVDRRQQDKRQPSYPPRQEHVSRYDNYRHTLSPGGVGLGQITGTRPLTIDRHTM